MKTKSNSLKRFSSSSFGTAAFNKRRNSLTKTYAQELEAIENSVSILLFAATSSASPSPSPTSSVTTESSEDIVDVARAMLSLKQ